jgi:hypothetical protein
MLCLPIHLLNIDKYDIIYAMSETSGDITFKPYGGNIHGAYPIPAVLSLLRDEKPEDLLFDGERVVEQIVQAAIQKPLAVSHAPRMENHIPLSTTHGVIIERSSLDSKTKRDPEVSRTITDKLTFHELGKEDGVFDRIRLTVRSAEYRGDSYNQWQRDIGMESWYIYFYKSGDSQPAAELFRGDAFGDSYIDVIDGDKHPHYHMSASYKAGYAKPFFAVADDYPELTRQMADALREAQIAVHQPMLPAINDREVIVTRSAAIGFRDPHTRYIGHIAHLTDRYHAWRDR